MGFAAPVDPDRATGLLADAVRAAGADHVEAALLARAGEYTRFAGERVHQPQDVTEQQVVVRAVVDGHAARVATGALDRVPDAVRRAAALARDLARTAAAPGSARPAAPVSDDHLLWHDDTAAFDAPARIAIAAEAMTRARRAGCTAAGMVGRAVTQLAVASSTGALRHVVATEATGSLTVGDGDGSAHWANLHRSRDALGLDAGTVADTVARAVRSRGREPLPDGIYTVVLGPEATGELLGFLGVLGFDGGLAEAGVGAATAPGRRVASDLVTVADDASYPFGLPVPFDVLGTTKSVVPLITAGLVGAPVTDRTGHAHVAREAVPSPVAANVVMAPGTHGDLVAGVENGLYVERFWYTRLVDRQAGTITGVSRDACFRIADGELGDPVRGARFTQSVFDLLSTVDGVGDELRAQPVMNVWNGAVTAPAIRAHGFRFGPR
ncbi:TldD/PmbA family protein [Actinosynnema sp. NPDC047251]|uniref:Peptidase U62, modulator of DNA gyrase n=1 Tax=Saccharothrix espanaensis (strain ATCC 51144 / DSM 44229 / JCM 9112 / NBRC 15066 / NRRL 15764) TaxID=1179773 RepID=K0K4N7_SACES|nr:TldD/PmbA family protein [Saccharothrix espanaensis]CCH32552.1 Peptidase U62, modulator of DNA gyrase [Saccharothrix espanaensis DSM 44229]